MDISYDKASKFIEWTKLKIRLHFNERSIYFKDGQIWWMNFGYNVGVEINGKNNNYERPGIILRKINRDSMLVVPISSKILQSNYHYVFDDSHGKPQTAQLAQIRLLSSKRLIRKIDKTPTTDFLEIKRLIKNLI